MFPRLKVTDQSAFHVTTLKRLPSLPLSHLLFLSLLVSLENSIDLFVTTRNTPSPCHHLPHPLDFFDKPGFAWDVIHVQKNTQAGWKRLTVEHAAVERFSLFLSYSNLNQDPDIKGRWSETMKLQVRCQLPFETKHSPNPGKTQPVPGIRTNKVELREEWQGRGGKSNEGGGFTAHVDNMASA